MDSWSYFNTENKTEKRAILDSIFQFQAALFTLNSISPRPRLIHKAVDKAVGKKHMGEEKLKSGHIEFDSQKAPLSPSELLNFNDSQPLSYLSSSKDFEVSVCDQFA